MLGPGPDLLEYGKYLDRLGDRRRAPSWTITPNEGDGMGRTLKTAATHLQPGEYKFACDFVVDRTRQVRKGRLTNASSAPLLSFGRDSRVGTHGALKSIVSPCNRWVSPAGPGDYASHSVDPTERHDRVLWPSAPAWSMPRNVPSGTRRKGGNMPGPGTYECPGHFDHISQHRQKKSDRMVRRSKGCQWESAFGNIFRSIHATQMRSAAPQAPHTLSIIERTPTP
mmetsp:Transcript_74651/g.207515  ORF Transcript_74651/g.207515 Transcript_74651/m.207515 type:complete len:225 (-) Transcript_74651:48-722(-)